MTGLIVVAPVPAASATRLPHGAHQVANRPIISHAVDSLRGAGIEDIAIVAPAAELAAIHACLEQVDGDGHPLTYIEGERGDLLGAITAAERFVDGRPAVVHAGDGLLHQPLQRLLAEEAASDLPDLQLMLYRNGGGHGGLGPATERLLGLSELDGPRGRLSVADICMFGPGALSRAVHDPAQDTGRGLIAVAEHLAATDSELSAVVVRGWQRFRGRPEDLLELNRLVLDQQVVRNDLIDHGDNRIEGRAVIHPTAEVRGSIVLGPCIIGAHARVESSYVGPYTSIGARAEIEGAEIVRSIVSDDVRIKHVGGRIEGSTIGRHASIFRDFALPRAMRLHVGEGVEVALD